MRRPNHFLLFYSHHNEGEEEEKILHALLLACIPCVCNAKRCINLIRSFKFYEIVVCNRNKLSYFALERGLTLTLAIVRRSEPILSMKSQNHQMQFQLTFAYHNRLSSQDGRSQWN